MTKFNSLTAFTLLTTLGLFGRLHSDDVNGFGDEAYKPTPIAEAPKPSLPAVNFPYDDSLWFLDATLLVWKPFVGDLDYGVKTNTVLETDPNIAVRAKPQKQAFEWHPGVRVTIGSYLSEHDAWDISAAGTYYYADSKNRSHPNLSKGSKLTPLGIPVGSSNPYDRAFSKWALNFFTADLAFGREFSTLSTINVHPFAGLRGAFIYQSNKTNYSGAYSNLLQEIVSKIKSKSHSKFWGVGPRVGSDFTLKFSPHFALLGSVSAGLYMGQYKNTGKIKEHITRTLAAVGNVTDDELFKIKDGGFTIRSNVEGSLGLGWEWYYTKRNHDVRIAPSIVFDASEWFGFNQYPRLQQSTDITAISSIVPPKAEYIRLLGDLGFIGVTINLHIDY